MRRQTNQHIFATNNIAPNVYRVPYVLSETHIKKVLSHPSSAHHDEDHGSHHIRARKPNVFPEIAQAILPRISSIPFGCGRCQAVDQHMRLYKMGTGDIVPLHIDYDFQIAGLSALWSILIYLNRNYTGGDTVFHGSIHVANIQTSDGVVFKHTIPHEGLAVEHGIKYVLKTDILFRIP